MQQLIFQLVAVLIIKVWFEYSRFVIVIVVEVACQWLIDSWVSHAEDRVSIDTHLTSVQSVMNYKGRVFIIEGWFSVNEVH